MGILSKRTTKIPINFNIYGRDWVFLEKMDAVYPYVKCNFLVTRTTFIRYYFHYLNFAYDVTRTTFVKLCFYHLNFAHVALGLYEFMKIDVVNKCT